MRSFNLSLPVGIARARGLRSLFIVEVPLLRISPGRLVATDVRSTAAPKWRVTINLALTRPLQPPIMDSLIDSLQQAYADVPFLCASDRLVLFNDSIALLKASRKQRLAAHDRLHSTLDAILGASVQGGAVDTLTLLRGIAELCSCNTSCPRLLEQAAWLLPPDVINGLSDTHLAIIALAFSSVSAGGRDVVRKAAQEAGNRAVRGTFQSDALIAVLTGVGRACIRATSLFESSSVPLTRYINILNDSDKVSGLSDASGIQQRLLQLVHLVRAYSMHSVVNDLLLQTFIERMSGLVWRILHCVAAKAYVPMSQRENWQNTISICAYHLVLLGGLRSRLDVFIDILHVVAMLALDGPLLPSEARQKLDNKSNYIPPRSIKELRGSKALKTTIHLIHVAVLAQMLELASVANFKTDSVGNYITLSGTSMPQPNSILPPQLAHHIAASYECGDTVTTRLQQDTFKSLLKMSSATSQPSPQLEYRTSIGLRIDIALAAESNGGLVSALPSHSPCDFSAIDIFQAAILRKKLKIPAGIAIEINGPFHYVFNAGFLGDLAIWEPLHGTDRDTEAMQV